MVYLVFLVYLVCLVYLVYLVCLVYFVDLMRTIKIRENMTEKCSQEVWSNLSILSISPVWFGQSFSKS
jgi:hypothetical protein